MNILNKMILIGEDMSDKERQMLLLNITELLYRRGLINEAERQRMKNIINGDEI